MTNKLMKGNRGYYYQQPITERDGNRIARSRDGVGGPWKSI